MPPVNHQPYQAVCLTTGSRELYLELYMWFSCFLLVRVCVYAHERVFECEGRVRFLRSVSCSVSKVDAELILTVENDVYLLCCKI